MSQAVPWVGEPPSSADLSVVICAYTLDRWDDILRAVSSVREQAPPVRDLILVCDHNDELRRRVEAELADVRVIENTEARGLSGARNSGLHAATGRVVAFLDDDAAAEPGWAAELVSGYADSGVIGVGGVSEPAWVAGRPAWFPEEFDWVVGCSYRGLPTRTAAVRNMIGSNMSFRREVFEEVGGFDPTVGRVGANPVGCEETELCIRAIARWPETRIVHEPRARVRHTVPAARGSWRYFRSRCFAEGRSKAQVTRLAGTSAGLASERRYTARVLPNGALRRVGEAIRARRATPLVGVGTIAAGLGYTVAGYLMGRLVDGRRPRHPARPRHTTGCAGERLMTGNQMVPTQDQHSVDALPDVTVVIPVRNAEAFIEECLAAVLDSAPAEVIVVDGRSTDRTVELAERFGVTVLTDHGRGVAAARLIGAEQAKTSWIALIDVDVLLHRGALRALFDEAVRDGYSALQGGLESTSGEGYWGRALVHHHRSGISKNWFGLVATLFDRETFLGHGLDPAFLSGEDIELRWRLERAGLRLGVSTDTVVEHRFGDTFEFAKGQFLADGAGLARMAAKHGRRALPLLGLPTAAAARGVVLSLVRRQPQWVPYYATFAALNWYGMARQLIRQGRRRDPPP